MSYNSLAQQITDAALTARITAAVQKEAWNNAEFGDTDYGTAVKQGGTFPPAQLGWPTCLATEAEYEYALDQGNPNPGGDEGVITDAQIQAAVQVNWPADPWPPQPPVITS